MSSLGVTDLIRLGLSAGILGTLAMDALNVLFARAGLITRIDVGTIGRMAGGWMRGEFRYGHPDEMASIEGEWYVGLITHYAIGVGLAIPYVFGWGLLIGDTPSASWAVPYGLGTTVASWFFVYPCMGFGALGLRSPDGWRAPFSSLANHLFYGLGLAVGILLL